MPDIKKATIKVNNDDKIEGILNNIKGIENYKLNNNNVFIEYDRDKIRYKKIYKKIIDNNINIELDNIVLTIGDMNCMGCMGVIKNSLNLLEGVIDVKIVFADKKTYIKYNSTLTNLLDIKKAVKRAGHQYILDIEGDNITIEDVNEIVEKNIFSKCDRF